MIALCDTLVVVWRGEDHVDVFVLLLQVADLSKGLKISVKSHVMMILELTILFVFSQHSKSVSVKLGQTMLLQTQGPH